MDDTPVSDSLAARSDVSNVLLLSSAFERGGPMSCPSFLEPTDAEPVSVVAVTVAATPDEWVSDVLGEVGAPTSTVCVVAVGDDNRSVAAGGTTAAPMAEVPVKQVASPGNLTALGVRLTECIEAAGEEPGRLTLCFESLSALLPHVEVRTAFQFLNVLTSLVGANDGFAHYHLDPEATDGGALAKLRPLFDAFVERDGSDGVTVRTR